MGREIDKITISKRNRIMTDKIIFQLGQPSNDNNKGLIHYDGLTNGNCLVGSLNVKKKINSKFEVKNNPFNKSKKLTINNVRLKDMKGFTNGNGLSDRNGLTNGNGLTDGNGLTNGNGLTDGNGLTNGNGLTDGNGLTNGNGLTLNKVRTYNSNHKASKISNLNKKALKNKISSIVFTIILILLPFLIYTIGLQEKYNSDGIYIDNEFEDWEDLKLFSDKYHDQDRNPNIDLIRYYMKRSDTSLLFYIEVDGNIFNGIVDNSQQYPDSISILIDSDLNPNTGYSKHGVGADYLIDLQGAEKSVTHNGLFEYNSELSTCNDDWSGWEYLSQVPIGMDNCRLEGEIHLPTYSMSNEFNAIVTTQDCLGNRDISDNIFNPIQNLVSVSASNIAPLVISASEKNIEFMLLEISKAEASDNQALINNLVFEVSGSTPDKFIESLRLFKLDETGALCSKEKLAPREGLGQILGKERNDAVTGSYAEKSTTYDPQPPISYGLLDTKIDKNGHNINLKFESPMLVPNYEKLNFIVTLDTNPNVPSTSCVGLNLNKINITNSVVSINQLTESLSYLNYVPQKIKIDGAFGDWFEISKIEDIDDYYLPNKNIDIQEFALNRDEKKLNFYFKVDEEILSALELPIQLNPLTKGKAQYSEGKMDNDENNKNVPLESLPKEIIAQDSLHIFLDTDKNLSTGYSDSWLSIGAEYMVKIIGHNGEITERMVYAYHSNLNNSINSDWSWEYIGSIPAAVDSTQLEAAINFNFLGIDCSHGLDVCYYLSNWDASIIDSSCKLNIDYSSLNYEISSYNSNNEINIKLPIGHKLTRAGFDDVRINEIMFNQSGGLLDCDWRYRKKITLNSSMVAGDLTDFPVLINITDTDLRDKARVDGFDIAFTNSNKEIKLDHEVESYNATTGELNAWVRIPTLSSIVDTEIYMYYGNVEASDQSNPDGVWDTNYMGVWHLAEEEVGSGNLGVYKDSSGNNNDGDDQVTAENKTGMINGGQEFNGSGDHIQVPHDETLNLTDAMTISYWIHPTEDVSTWYRIVEKGYWGYQTAYYFGGGNGLNDLTFYLNNSAVFDTVDNVLKVNEWQQAVVSYTSSGDATLFLNGVAIDSGSYTGAIPGNLDTLYISYSHMSFDFPGYIDEVRISNVARNTAWILTTYNMTNSSNLFNSLGSEELISRPDWVSAGNIRNWLYRKKIIINSSQVPGDLIDFPVLISITDSDLQNKAQSNGYDIKFTESDGKTDLDHEIEKFNSSSGELVAWIRIPALSSSVDTEIYMYYGNSIAPDQSNPSGVWSKNFVNVWHLAESGGTGPFLRDSVGNSAGGDVVNAVFNESGKIDGAYDFDGDDDYIDTNYASSNSIITISAWITPKELTYGAIVDKLGELHFWQDPTTDSLYFERQWSVNVGGWYSPINGIQGNQTYHVSVVYDGSSTTNDPLFYINGSLVSTTEYGWGAPAGTIVSTTNDHFIGIREGLTVDFNGTIDEVRISNALRPSDWITTEHNNANFSSDFVSISIEEPIYDNNWTTSYDTGHWLYRKSITIDSKEVDGDLTDFPMLIKETDSDLMVKAQSNGYDILFTDSDGITKLDFEIETFNSTTGELVAWVRLPSLSSTTDKVIYMYYGNRKAPDQSNASGVWINNYNAVWHLKEDPTGTAPQFEDSTSNSNDGTANGAMTATDQVSGKIDGSIDFDGSDDRINIPQDSSLDIATDVTISSWFKLDSSHDSTSSSKLICEKYLDANWNFHLVLTGSDYNEGSGTLSRGSLVYKINTQGSGDEYVYKWTLKKNWAANTWYHFTILHNVTDHTSNRILINGVDDIGGFRQNSQPTDFNFNSDWNIGGGQVETLNIGSGWAYFDGILDEFRISSVNRSDDWITTGYNNQYSPNVFYSLGSEDSIPGFEWVELYNADTTAVDLSGWTLTDNDDNTFNLTGAGIIPPEGYLLCHLGQFGLNSSTEVYGLITSGGYSLRAMLESMDDLALINSSGTVVDYVSWGGDPGSDDDSAVSYSEWTDGNFVDSFELINEETLGRDKYSTDTNIPSNWQNPSTSKADPYGVNSTIRTPGAQNLYPGIVINEIMLEPNGNEFQYRKLITIDHNRVVTDLTNFPVLIYITSDIDLATNAQNDGDDITFTQFSNPGIQLNHEIQSFNGATGELIAWVNVTDLSSTEDTKIWMYYGNSTCGSQEKAAGVWDDGYEIVWHLQETGVGSTDEYKDSSGNGIHGTGGKDDDSGGLGDATETPTRVAGKFGYAQDFNDDGFTGDRISSINLTSAWSAVTGSVWIYGNSAGDDRIWGKSWGSAVDDNSILMRCIGTGANQLGSRFRTDTSANTGYEPASMENNAWIHYVLTWDGSSDDTVRIYKNGILQGSGAVVSGNTLYNNPPHEFFTLGNVGDGAEDRCFNGYIQEARMSSTRRDSNWIKTEYNNQKSPSKFFTLGIQESVNAQWVELYNLRDSTTSLAGCSLIDNDGNSFNLSSANSIAPGGYVICYLGLSGINSTTEIFGPIENAGPPPMNMLDNIDDLSLLDSDSKIMDFIAWGGNGGTDDDNAAAAGEWSDGAYIKTALLQGYETLGRDKDSFDSNSPTDWENSILNTADPYGINSTIKTPGARNLYEPIPYRNVVINEIMFNPANSGWKYRKKISINSSLVSGDLNNFPVLLRYKDPDLPSKARSDGYDIYFTASNGQTRLNHEIESYNSSSGDLIAWINITSLSSSIDTDFYIYYGNPSASDQQNPTGVWNDNFSAVWHLNNDPSGAPPQISDSTSYNNDGTTGGSMASNAQIKGKIGGSIDFDGIDDNATMPTNGFSTTAGTVETWVNIESFPSSDSEYIFAHRQASPITDRIYLRVWDSTEWGTGMGDAYDLVRGSTLNTNSWNHLVITWDGTNVSGYLNGILDFGPTAYTGLNTVREIYIMSWDPTMEWANGTLDELRISNSARTADWIATSFNNQNHTYPFFDIYREEIISYQWVELYNNDDSTVDLTGWEISDNDGNTFDLTGAGSIPSGSYLICHLAQTGTNSSSNVYGPILNETSSPMVMFESNDDIVLSNSRGNIIDYLAWGADAGSQDNRAVLYNSWTNGAYVDITGLNENETIGRDKDSYDSDAPSDWENTTTNFADPFGINATIGTPGEQNFDHIIPEYNILFFPVLFVIVATIIFNRYFNKIQNLELKNKNNHKNKTNKTNRL